MSYKMLIKGAFFATAVCLSIPAQATPDDGKWWEAESDRFRVYSEGSREDAVAMATRLERLDQAMRMFRGMQADTTELPDTSKVTVYQFGRTADIGGLINSRSVAGFFIPRAGNSVAFVPLVEDRRQASSSSPGTRDQVEFYDYTLRPQAVLFHEYTHYFMFQHAPAAYPFWYIEGFAELFATLDLTETGFNLGEVPDYRRGLIQRYDVDIDRMVDPPRQFTQGDAMLGYAHGWLAVNYLSFEPARKGQLANYLRLINGGTKSKDAAVQAFGDLKKLEKELNAYRRERARGLSVQFPEMSVPDVEVRELGAAENAIMALHVQQQAGVTESKAKRLVSDARELAARYPNDPKVLLAATEAELDAENLAEANAFANRVLEIDKESVPAHLFLARVAMKHAETDPAYLTAARRHYVDANMINSRQPEALAGYYLTYVLAGAEAPEEAKLALENAYTYAPFDQKVRTTLSHLLLTENRDKEAIVLLGPIANSPHSNKETRTLRDLLAKLEEGDRQPLVDKLKPKLKDEEES